MRLLESVHVLVTGVVAAIAIVAAVVRHYVVYRYSDWCGLEGADAVWCMSMQLA
jgi:hypothetical protein